MTVASLPSLFIKLVFLTKSCQTLYCSLGAKYVFATKSPFSKGGFRGNVNTWSFLPSIS